MTETVVLAKATGAGNSADFIVNRTPVTVSAYPEANFGSDTGELARKNPDGTYDDVFANGAVVACSATNPQFIVYGAGTYRIEFSARTAAIGVVYEASPLA